MQSGKKDLVEYIEERRAFIYKEDENGKSQLLNAYGSGNTDFVEFLIEQLE